MPQRVRDRAIPARALAEYAAAPGPATSEALLDRRHHFIWQEVLPSTNGSRVGVLVAAEPGEAIGEGDDNGWHALFADQPVEPFRQVLAEADPVRMGQATARKANKIYQQRQSLSVMPSREVHIDDTHRGIAQHIALEGLALDGVTRLMEPIDPKNLRMRPTPGFADVIRGYHCRRFINPFDHRMFTAEPIRKSGLPRGPERFARHGERPNAQACAAFQLWRPPAGCP